MQVSFLVSVAPDQPYGLQSREPLPHSTETGSILQAMETPGFKLVPGIYSCCAVLLDALNSSG